MPHELERPATPSELYLARGDEVNVDRPLLQGDVFADIVIPGVEGGPGLAAIVTHSCAMRRDGVHLIERLLVARVEPSSDVPLERWPAGHFKILPLPELRGDGGESHALKYELCGRVDSEDLLRAERIACLDPFGICLLLQRKVHNEARVVVPTDDFYEACAPVFEEADLLEEWTGAAREANEELDQALIEFHNFIRAGRQDEKALQEALHDPARRPHVRRIVREQIAARYGVNAS